MPEDFYLPNGYTYGNDLCIPNNSFIIIKLNDEDRCKYIAETVYSLSENILLIGKGDRYGYEIILKGKSYIIRNRGKDEFDSLLKNISSEEIYIDITSLDVYEIPRLIKGFYGKKKINCIYAEPESYVSTSLELAESDYNLYETHSEVSAIPGYSIFRPDDDYNFVPILGFQGSRLIFIRESLQVLEENTYSIIGFPGYKLEFGFACISENRRFLESRKILRNISYYPANTPFKVYRMLKKLKIRTNKSVVVGLLGTKPQALGAIIFAIKNPKDCELIYDYPTKQQSKFIGWGKIYIYKISDMWDVIDSVA